LISEPLKQIQTASAASELLRAVRSVERDGGRTHVFGDVPVRPLYRDEIERLEQLGNSSLDWSRVHVADGFDYRKVRNCSFHGDVLLGRLNGQVRLLDGVELPVGLANVTICHCVIGHDVLLRDVKLLANYVLEDGVILIDCGRIFCDGATTFGNGALLPVGPESGGRDIAVYAEMDFPTAKALTRADSRRAIGRAYADAVADYRAQACSSRGIIGRRTTVQSTPSLRNCYIGPGARIDGATLLADTTVLSSEEEPARVESGAMVTASLLQWGSSVMKMAIVDRSVLMEHAHVEAHAGVTASILGPNTAVAKGEVTSCLLGPFVSMHHQSLLIATVWPEGRGNISAGANVGANHSTKAPDQEFWAGEGLFLGLGVSVKFPADFSRSPYSVLAAGVTTLPQRVTFPFSLINTPSAAYPGISPAFNQITPAWVLSDNLYMLKRNESKFQSRNRARRHQFDFRILRPYVVDLMVDACRRLENVPRLKEIYTDRDIEGLGKNFLLEEHRTSAIDAYRFFIRYYALLGLKAEVEEAAHGGRVNGAIARVLTMPSERSDWDHARHLLSQEPGVRDATAGLTQLLGMLDQVAVQVERSKEKDDQRGARIIDDYADVHAPAQDDSLVRRTWQETRETQAEVMRLLPLLQSTAKPPTANVQLSVSDL
jgi:Domain of unknown function (DUF4954)